jgi:hypothetical protein
VSDDKERPDRATLSVDVITVEVPVLDEDDLTRFERRLQALITTATEVRTEARRILGVVQAAVRKYGGEDPKREPIIKLVKDGDVPGVRSPRRAKP